MAFLRLSLRLRKGRGCGKRQVGFMHRPPHLLLFQTTSQTFDRRGLWLFVLTYLGAFFLAGLLAYPVYLGFQALGSGADPDTFRGWLARQGIHRIADRIRLLAAAAGTLWLIGYAGLWGCFGWKWQGESRRILLWAGAGVVMLIPPIALQLLSGQSALRVDPELGKLLGILGGAILTAVVVSFLEESIFRGMLLRLFATALRSWPALLLSAVVFSAVHFKSVRWMGTVDPSFLSAVKVAGAGFLAPVLTFDLILFLNLFLVGFALSLLFWKTGNLMACFGLHVGWVIAQRSSVGLFESRLSEPGLFLGSPLVTDGLLGLAMLTGFSVWLVLCFRREPPTSPSEE